MKLNEVIQAGDLNAFEMIFATLESYLWPFLLSFLFVMVVANLIYFGMKSKEEKLLIISALLVVYLIPVSIALKVMYTDSEAYQEWKTDYVFPYVEELPAETYEIQSFNPIAYKPVSGPYFLSESIKISDLVSANIVYTNEENTGVQETMNILVKYDLEEGDMPYLEMKFLEASLGYGIESGYINPVVHLPKNYTLNYQ